MYTEPRLLACYGTAGFWLVLHEKENNDDSQFGSIQFTPRSRPPDRGQARASAQRSKALPVDYDGGTGRRQERIACPTANRRPSNRGVPNLTALSRPVTVLIGGQLNRTATIPRELTRRTTMTTGSATRPTPWRDCDIMNWHQRKVAHVPGKLGLVTAGLGLAFLLIGEAGAQTTFGGNAQHTANYSPTAQSLNAVHWTTSVDLNNTGGYAHYGAPLITPANTIFVPVKTGATGGFQISVFNAASGAAIYSLSTDYTQPSHNWILPYQPVLATSSETRLYYPGNGGTIYYIDNVDSASHGTPVQQVFYTTLANYQANAAAFNSTVFIDTPITADSSGNVFFGFRVNGTAPAPLSTTQGGFARSEEHTSELQSPCNLVCRLLLEKKKKYLRVVFARAVLGRPGGSLVA